MADARYKLFAWAWMVTLVACQPQASNPQNGPGPRSREPVRSTQVSQKTECQGATTLLADSKAAVAFKEDILPILVMSEEGKEYKCTTCHHHFNKPEHVIEDLDKIVESMESGFMPYNGNPDEATVSEEEIALFRLWRDGGFLLSKADLPEKDSKEKNETPTKKSPSRQKDSDCS